MTAPKAPSRWLVVTSVWLLVAGIVALATTCAWAGSLRGSHPPPPATATASSPRIGTPAEFAAGLQRDAKVGVLEAFNRAQAAARPRPPAGETRPARKAFGPASSAQPMRAGDSQPWYPTNMALTEPRSFAAITFSDNNIIIAGGCLNANCSQRSAVIDSVDPVTNTVSRRGTLPIALSIPNQHNPTLPPTVEPLTIAGATAAISVLTFSLTENGFTEATNVWIVGPCATLPALPQSYFDNVSASELHSSIWQLSSDFSTVGIFKKLTGLAPPRANASCISYLNRIFIVGGVLFEELDEEGNPRIINTVDAYDIAWDIYYPDILNLGTARMNAAIAVDNAMLYVGGGQTRVPVNGSNTTELRSSSNCEAFLFSPLYLFNESAAFTPVKLPPNTMLDRGLSDPRVFAIPQLFSFAGVLVMMLGTDLYATLTCFGGPAATTSACTDASGAASDWAVSDYSGMEGIVGSAVFAWPDTSEADRVGTVFTYYAAGGYFPDADAQLNTIYYRVSDLHANNPLQIEPFYVVGNITIPFLAFSSGYVRLSTNINCYLTAANTHDQYINVTGLPPNVNPTVTFVATSAVSPVYLCFSFGATNIPQPAATPERVSGAADPLLAPASLLALPSAEAIRASPSPHIGRREDFVPVPSDALSERRANRRAATNMRRRLERIDQQRELAPPPAELQAMQAYVQQWDPDPTPAAGAQTYVAIDEKYVVLFGCINPLTPFSIDPHAPPVPTTTTAAPTTTAPPTAATTSTTAPPLTTTTATPMPTPTPTTTTTTAPNRASGDPTLAEWLHDDAHAVEFGFVIAACVGIVALAIALVVRRYKRQLAAAAADVGTQGNTTPGGLDDPLLNEGIMTDGGKFILDPNDAVVRNTTLDSRYRIVRRIGQGSFSSVYLVRRKNDSLPFALKYLICQNDRDRLEAIKECETINSIQGHPNIIALFDMFMNYEFGRAASSLSTMSRLDDRSSPNAPAPAATERNSLLGGPQPPPVMHREADTRPPPPGGANGAPNGGANGVPAAYGADSQQQSVHTRYLCLIMEYHPSGDLCHYLLKRSRMHRENFKQRLVEYEAYCIAHNTKPPSAQPINVSWRASTMDESLRPVDDDLPAKPYYQPLNESALLSVAMQLCAALHHLHSCRPAPIVHRDLKPENVLIRGPPPTPQDTFIPILITDFGLAFLQEENRRSGRGGGTRPYISPESWRGQTTTASDMWSLGCVLYALATERLVAENVRIMFEDVRRPSFRDEIAYDLGAVHGYSHDLVTLILALLDPEPRRRPSAGYLLRCFEERCPSPAMAATDPASTSARSIGSTGRQASVLSQTAESSDSASFSSGMLQAPAVSDEERALRRRVVALRLDHVSATSSNGSTDRSGTSPGTNASLRTGSYHS